MAKEKIRFSVIIPVYQAETYISFSLGQILTLDMDKARVEYIFVDDCSTDNTLLLLEEFALKNPGLNVRVLKTVRNEGPGIARNVGLEVAKGDWIVFLDSDDYLRQDFFTVCERAINTSEKSTDLMIYDWQYSGDSNTTSRDKGRRIDKHLFAGPRDELLKWYLALWTDNSVIFTLMKKTLIDRRNLRFRAGLHEDVDFLFKAFLYARRLNYIDEAIYVKCNRNSSIINSFSEYHITGFIRAFYEILEVLKQEKKFTEPYTKYFTLGMVALLYTLLVRTWRHASRLDPGLYREKLYCKLYDEWLSLRDQAGLRAGDDFYTKYFIIQRHFLKIMKPAGKRKKTESNIHVQMDAFFRNIMEKSWSCYDLHNSLFMAPDEIRVCCKRFFVNGNRKGDVVLREVTSSGDISPEKILEAKFDLYSRINRGIADECMGCPHLKFKAWRNIRPLSFEYLSFEYHTQCNFKCIYCSNKYNGGKRCSYNIDALFSQLLESGSLRHCGQVVWGGGEPTLDPSFDSLIARVSNALPHIRQKIFTNASIYSGTVQSLLDKGIATIVTSIDAGTSETFHKIKRKNAFDEVLKNLSRYVAKRPENTVIKYIVLQENMNLDELRAFQYIVQERRLLDANFQISVNFKTPSMEKDSLIASSILYGLLYIAGARFIYFDDLFYQRTGDLFLKEHASVLNALKKHGLLEAMALPQVYKEIAIWGAGDKTGFLMKKTSFFQHTKVVAIVDDAIEKQGTLFGGHLVQSPDILRKIDVPVLISSYVGSRDILNRYLALGLEEERIIKEMII